MNTKRLLWATIAVLIVIGVVGYVVHHVLLSDIYKQTASVWRPEADMKQMLATMWIGHLIYALMFVFIYTRGIEKRKNKIEQGVRYGIYVTLLVCVPGSIMWYVILPIPGMLAVYWSLAGLVESVIAGMAVASIYKA